MTAPEHGPDHQPGDPAAGQSPVGIPLVPDRLAGAAADRQYHRERAPFLASPVELVEPRAGQSHRALFQAMWHAGGPPRNLAGVYRSWEEMLRRPQQAAWLAIAGAYIPFGLGRTMCLLMEHHFIDVLVTTPAQLTHDLTDVRGRHHFHGDDEADDNLLQRLDVNRYWNVYGDERELNEHDDLIMEFAETLADRRAYTSGEYFWRLGVGWPKVAGKLPRGCSPPPRGWGCPSSAPAPATATSPAI